MHSFRSSEEGYLFLIDPETPAGGAARVGHKLRRASSLGFNSALVVLRPT